ncbi:VIT1/CCC1 transporter family protein [Thermogladius sp.]|uniref:VIT1/CCC1 transporter family protein n=1 Tax=Thermogladius sp. TaxID=2023064 RepID=UPI003D12C6A3
MLGVAAMESTPGSIDPRQAYRFCLDEAFSLEVYRSLSKLEKDEERRRILSKLAEDEERHYEFWREYAGKDCRPGYWRVWLFKLSYVLLGPLFTIKLLERGEESAIREYASLLGGLSGEARSTLEALIKDEESHEKELIGILSDPRLKYLGFVALGLADAIVEITGVNAGFLGATENTAIVGLAGLIVGFSAALSMAGASYLQSKHEKRVSPTKSAVVTGLAYILSVLLLVAPFFTMRSLPAAFAASVTASVLLTGVFTYYSSVVEDKEFKREFLESLSLLLGIALASYLLGAALSRHLGISTGL